MRRQRVNLKDCILNYSSSWVSKPTPTGLFLQFAKQTRMTDMIKGILIPYF